MKAWGQKTFLRPNRSYLFFQSSPIGLLERLLSQSSRFPSGKSRLSYPVLCFLWNHNWASLPRWRQLLVRELWASLLPNENFLSSKCFLAWCSFWPKSQNSSFRCNAIFFSRRLRISFFICQDFFQCTCCTSCTSCSTRLALVHQSGLGGSGGEMVHPICFISMEP